MNVALFGYSGKVGRVLEPALMAAGHTVAGYDLRRGGESMAGIDVAVDFTAPRSVEGNVRAALEQGVPVVVGTSGWDPQPLGELARERGVQLFVVPNFALGAVVMMRLAAEAARFLPNAEIVEMHHESKFDRPSGTAKATADLLGGDVAVHSVRLPGLVAHQEVLFGGDGQLLTIRHDTFSREAFVPGVLLALEKLRSLPPGLTVGLEHVL